MQVDYVSAHVWYQAAASGGVERRIVGFEVLFIVEKALNVSLFHRDSQQMPGVVSRHFGGLELRALPIDDLVEAKIALQGIEAAQVVIPRVPGAPHDAASLIDLSIDGLEPHAEVDVGVVRILDQRAAIEIEENHIRIRAVVCGGII